MESSLSTPRGLRQVRFATWSFLLYREDSGPRVLRKLARALPTVPFTPGTITPNMVTLGAPADAGPALAAALAHDALPAAWEPPTPPPEGHPHFQVKLSFRGRKNPKVIRLPISAGPLVEPGSHLRWVTWALKYLDRPCAVAAAASLPHARLLWSWSEDQGLVASPLTHDDRAYIRQLVAAYP